MWLDMCFLCGVWRYSSYLEGGWQTMLRYTVGSGSGTADSGLLLVGLYPVYRISYHSVRNIK
jgi:hypothetical protein